MRIRMMHKTLKKIGMKQCYNQIEWTYKNTLLILQLSFMNFILIQRKRKENEKKKERRSDSKGNMRNLAVAF